MNRFDPLKVVLKRLPEGLGKHCDAVLSTLGVANGDFAPAKVDILDAQSQTLHETQTGTVHQRRREPFGFNFLGDGINDAMNLARSDVRGGPPAIRGCHLYST